MKRNTLVGILIALVTVAVLAPTVAGGVAGPYGMMGLGGMMMGPGGTMWPGMPGVRGPGMMGSQGPMGGPGMMGTPSAVGTTGPMMTPGTMPGPGMMQGVAAQGMAGNGWGLGFAIGLATAGQLAFWGALFVGLALLADWVHTRRDAERSS